jgi:hypothetical protein
VIAVALDSTLFFVLLLLQWTRFSVICSIYSPQFLDVGLFLARICVVWNRVLLSYICLITIAVVIWNVSLNRNNMLVERLSVGQCLIDRHLHYNSTWNSWPQVQCVTSGWCLSWSRTPRPWLRLSNQYTRQTWKYSKHLVDRIYLDNLCDHVDRNSRVW